MLKKSTVLISTVCTLGLCGGIGGLVYELQKPEDIYHKNKKLLEEIENLKTQEKRLSEKLSDINNEQEIERINKDIDKLKETITTKTNEFFKNMENLTQKILDLIPDIKKPAKVNLNSDEINNNIKNLLANIITFETKKIESKDENFEEQKIEYEKETKSKIFKNFKAQEIYEKIVEILKIHFNI